MVVLVETANGPQKETQPMTKAPYEDWLEAVKDELKARGLDIGEAFDAYSFRTAYEEYDLKPAAAVRDYQEWWFA